MRQSLLGDSRGNLGDHRRARAIDCRAAPSIIEASHCVDLIQLPTYDGPELAQDAPGRPAIDAIPDVARSLA